jgi:hypothetical protein
MRMKPPVRAKKPAPKKATPRFTGALGTPAMIVMVFCIMGAAILIAISRPAPVDEMPAATAQPRQAAIAAHSTVATAAPRATDVATADASDRAPEPVAASALKAAPVTMTGCLEQNDENFRLKNVVGEDAPKARSWKSGFFKKGPAPIDVVDSAHHLKLPAHVGHRVSVTGVLVGREMQVRSLRSVASSCNQKS